MRGHGLKPYAERINTLLVDLLNADSSAENAYLQVYEQIPMAKRTFYQYWSKAKEAHLENTVILRDKLLKHSNQETIKKIKKTRVTKESLIDRLLLIIDGKCSADRDRINGIRLICDIEGYKAPTNMNHNIINPMPIFSDNPLAGDTIDISHTEER